MQRGPGIILLCLLLLLLASCGGSGTVPALDEGIGGNNNGNHEALTLEQWAARSHGSLAPQAETGLPAFPLEDPSDVRTTSGDSDRTVLGDEYLLEEGSMIMGDGSIILNGALTFREDDFPGWALYKIGGLADLRPESLNVECVPQGLSQEYWIGVADFTHLRWQWFGPVGIPEYQLDLSEEDSQYISNMGNLYFLLVCHDDNAARHYQTTVVANGGECLPGAPTDLYASKGEFPDGVALYWNPGSGAAYYEVERREAQVWIQDDGTVNHGGDPLDPEDEIAWEQLGTTPENMFFDYRALPDIMYEYRVRSVNDCGASSYSNIDWGFAFGNGGGGNYSLQGYTYAYGEGQPPSGGGGGEPGDDGDGDPNNDGGGDGDPGTGGGGYDIYPLPGVMLNIVAADGSFMATTISDDSGFYYIEQLPPGQYTVTAALEGWGFDPPEAYFEISDWSPSVWIDFIGYSSGGGDQGVHGTVYSGEAGPDGQLLPLAGADVRVSDPNTGVIVSSITTGEDGFYQFLELPEGYYELSAAKEGWSFDGQLYYFEVINGVPDIWIDFYGVPVD